MCLILFAERADSRYPLVLAANRDEFLDRPASEAGFWADAPQVLGGRDLDRGGTWLGVTSQGRWAAVTNFREGVRPDPGVRSRGLLTRDFLFGSAAAESYVEQVALQAEQFAGFNLLVGDALAAFYLCNRPLLVQRVPPGIHGLSNHLLNTTWPKVRRGRTAMVDLLGSDEDVLVGGLFALLSDRQQASDGDLPSTGVTLEWERRLSASFILSEGYGTRASTVTLVRADGSIRFEERSFGAGGAEAGRKSFDLPPHPRPLHTGGEGGR
ncbi:MAG: NRDE family protein [Burkholderiales bacterium]